MGGEQAANTMVNVTEASMKRKGEVDQAKLDALKTKIVDNFDRQMDVFTTSAHLLDDGVIDPRDTRTILSYVLSICRDAETRQPQRMQFSVARP
jgi:geranyl-CoA carboxylase beta subunit